MPTRTKALAKLAADKRAMRELAPPFLVVFVSPAGVEFPTAEEWATIDEAEQRGDRMRAKRPEVGYFVIDSCGREVGVGERV